MEEFSSVSLMFDTDDLLEPHGKIIRNRLNLGQRIEVLKQFSRTPDVGQLAQIFKCGRRQIRNILRKRQKYITMWSRNKHRYDEDSIQASVDSISADYISADSLSALTDAVGFILYEWVQRAKCYRINITDEILCNFGKEAADHIQFKSFQATDDWLASFKGKYNLTDLDLNIKLEKYFIPQERKPLSISVVIADLRREYGESAIPMANDNKVLYENDDSNPFDVVPEVSRGKRESVMSESSDSGLQMDNDDISMATGSQDRGREIAKAINNYKEALNQLGPLEQFALMKENVRAVGLINQLENLFRERLLNEL